MAISQAMSGPIFWFGFVLGLVVGSYLNVVIFRYGKSSSLRGRSVCPQCNRELAAWELIPIISYIVLGGRCRTCHKPISWRYPVGELLAGLATGGILFGLGPTLAGWSLVAAAWFGIVIFWIDIDQMIIPDAAVLGLAAAAFLWQISQNQLANGVLGAVVLAVLISLVILLSRGVGMGWGDAKLAAALGLLMGWPIAPVGLFIAILLGAVVGIALLLAKRAKKKDPIPFAPFLLIGSAVALIWGAPLLHWYLSISGF